MKAKFSICLIISLVIFCFCGCTKSEKTLSEIPLDNGSYYLIEKSDQNIVSIHIPVFDKKTNDLIYDKMLQKTNEITLSKLNLKINEQTVDLENNEYANIYLQLDYQVSMISDEIISLIFKGIFAPKSAAYPTSIFFTVNVDLQSDECFNFSREISDNLYETFIRNAKEQYPDFTDYLNSCMNFESFSNGLITGVYNCYYENNKLGISIPTIHALGDHIEVEIRSGDGLKS